MVIRAVTDQESDEKFHRMVTEILETVSDSAGIDWRNQDEFKSKAHNLFYMIEDFVAEIKWGFSAV